MRYVPSPSARARTGPACESRPALVQRRAGRAGRWPVRLLKAALLLLVSALVVLGGTVLMQMALEPAVIPITEDPTAASPPTPTATSTRAPQPALTAPPVEDGQQAKPQQTLLSPPAPPELPATRRAMLRAAVEPSPLGGGGREDASDILRYRAPYAATRRASAATASFTGGSASGEGDMVSPVSTVPQAELPVATAAPTRTVTATWTTPTPAAPPPPPDRLEIPGLGIDAPVVEIPITDGTWDVSPLTHEVAHLGQTGYPGEDNNMVLAGHVTLKKGAGPFLRLETLEPGDAAIVHAGDRAHVYRVVSKRVVAPDDVSVTYPTSEPILTLLTCTGWDAANRSYTHRVAIICELDKGQAPSTGS